MRNKSIATDDKVCNSPSSENTSSSVGPPDAGCSIDHLSRHGNEKIDENIHRGVAFGHTFIEKLLIGLIRADKSRKVDEARRLKQAMRALFDRDPTKHPMPGDKNERMLLWMADRLYTNQLRRPSGQQRQPKVTSRELARAELLHFGANPNADEFPENLDQLSDKFTGSYQRKLRSQRRNGGLPPKSTYLYRVAEHDYVVESIEQQNLQNIKNILSLFDVDVDIESLRYD